jgi:hypothetical protein
MLGNALNGVDALGAFAVRQHDRGLKVDQTRKERILLRPDVDRHPLVIDAVLLTVLRDEGPHAASQLGCKQQWRLRAATATAHHIRHIDYHRMIVDL